MAGRIQTLGGRNAAGDRVRDSHGRGPGSVHSAARN